MVHGLLPPSYNPKRNSAFDNSPVIDQGEELEDEEHSVARTDSNGSSTSFENGENLQIGADESRAVNRVRAILIVVLLFVATSVSSAVYLYSHEKEKNDFQNQFQVFAEKIIDDIMATTERSLRAIEGFALQITIHSIDHHQVWPNVALSDFETRARITIDLADAISLVFIPIVTADARPSWEKFSGKNQDWLTHGLALQEFIDNENEDASIEQLEQVYGKDDKLRFPKSINKLNNFTVSTEDGPGPYAPYWQFAPAFPVSTMVNLNTMSIPSRSNEIAALMESERTTISKAIDYVASSDIRASVLNLFLNRANGSYSQYTGGPVSDLYSPIFDHFGDDNQMVGLITSYVYWQVYFENVLPDSVNGIVAVMENSCNQAFTFELNGAEARYVGEGDLHDPKYDDLEVSAGFGGIFLQEVDDLHDGQCLVNIRIFPSDKMENDFLTSTPLLFTIVLVSTFIFTSLVFLWYQHLVDKRQMVVMKAAVQSRAVVQSLFPANVRERLFEEAEMQQPKNTKGDIRKFMNHKDDDDTNDIAKGTVLTSENIFGSKPIADLFANTTVLFADMVGFTAWASVREPTQVFTLLETIYHSFDMLAKKLRVFKVETVGDCYVAVAGLPTPRKDHAIVMAKFAWSCRFRMGQLCRELEKSLGPDTAELGLRIGLHSGPVTAGVLRGDKGRFQLFGDTINTASRMESTGLNGRIHLSRDTADILIGAGKSHWLEAREGKVVAKGKGELQTYWLTSFTESTFSNRSDGNSSGPSLKMETMANAWESERNSFHDENAEKNKRLVQWCVDILSRLLKQIIARRSAGNKRIAKERDFSEALQVLQIETVPGETVLDEVKDIIALPEFSIEAYKRQADIESIQLHPDVSDQLTTLVTEIAGMYKSNPFHNFEHASHVTMSVTKLMSRIVNPVEVLTKGHTDHQIASELHDHTFGITSDPLTQFSCVFAGLIHDLDHPGVTNSVLVEEKLPVAEKYRNKSVAEQNSVDLAWALLNQPRFEELRNCIYKNMDELKRFRELVVNVVMATDIMDKDLGTQRKARWAKAFSEETRDNVREDVNRKATIVIEHLIQASDVAHTMQHWHVYKKWNERLFHEMYRAYKAGRLAKDPTEFWYKGEIGFFDFYIIPLAKKLETCGVFGVSSDEYLNYALANRREWEAKGEAIVKGYVESYKKKKL